MNAAAVACALAAAASGSALRTHCWEWIVLDSDGSLWQVHDIADPADPTSAPCRSDLGDMPLRFKRVEGSLVPADLRPGGHGSCSRGVVTAAGGSADRLPPSGGVTRTLSGGERRSR